MKLVLICIILTVLPFWADCQNGCSIIYPKRNLRPDTITRYVFKDRILRTNQIPIAKATSNASFRTKNFNLIWMPITASDIEIFVKTSLEGLANSKILDTFRCVIFDEVYTVLIIQSKRKIHLLFYQRKIGQQDIFIATNMKRRRIPTVLKQISTYLHE